jgi:hypothetical protein
VELPHYGQNTAALREALAGGYEGFGYSDSSRSIRIIERLKTAVGMGSSLAAESIPWAIAAAIITEDEAIQGLSDDRRRLLLDVAIEVPREYHDSIYRRAVKKSVYAKDEDNREGFREIALKHKALADGWENQQALLREEASPTGLKERE